MPKQFEVRYRWSWLDFQTRAELFDGERWVRLSKDGTERQRQSDAYFRDTIESIFQNCGHHAK